MREPDFRWAGRPVYRCRVCKQKYERIENLAAVLAHEVDAHGSTERVSPIAGPKGEAIIVTEDR